MRKRKTAITLPLILVLIVAACNRGFNFSQELRTIVALSGPLVESLPIQQSLKDVIVNDFSSIANSAATFKESLDACGSDAGCKVAAVEMLTVNVNQVLNTGRWGGHERLVQIQRTIQGIINAARIYYGAPAITTARSAQPMSKSEAEKAMKNGMKELKSLMEPVK